MDGHNSGEMHLIHNLRMKEVLEEPGTEDGDGTFRKAALRPPNLLLLEHANLLEGTLVP